MLCDVISRYDLFCEVYCDVCMCVMRVASRAGHVAGSALAAVGGRRAPPRPFASPARALVVLRAIAKCASPLSLFGVLLDHLRQCDVCENLKL
jgi:hypothetical protein